MRFDLNKLFGALVVMVNMDSVDQRFSTNTKVYSYIVTPSCVGRHGRYWQ